MRYRITNYDLGKAYLRKQMFSQAIAEFQKSVNLFKVSERDAALALNCSFVDQGPTTHCETVQAVLGVLERWPLLRD
jgi:hypothetical protein